MWEPEHLFKYRPLDTPEQEGFLQDILVNDRLFFATPSMFNDPFDCAPSFDTTWTEREIRQVARRQVERHFTGHSRAIRRTKLRLFEARLRQNKKEDTDRIAGEWLKEFRNEMAVLSLAAHPDIVLMWSHYASNHRGVCLRFQHESPLIEEALEVQYDKDRPAVDLMGVRDDKLRADTLLAKADYWFYESEWRVIRPGGSRKHGFQAKALDGIILGALIEPRHEEMIRGWVARRNIKRQVMRARLDDRLYRTEVLDA